MIDLDNRITLLTENIDDWINTNYYQDDNNLKYIEDIKKYNEEFVNILKMDNVFSFVKKENKEDYCIIANSFSVIANKYVNIVNNIIEIPTEEKNKLQLMFYLFLIKC